MIFLEYKDTMTVDSLKKRSHTLLVTVLHVVIAGMLVAVLLGYCLWNRFKRKGKITFIDMVKYSIVWIFNIRSI